MEDYQNMSEPETTTDAGADGAPVSPGALGLSLRRFTADERRQMRERLATTTNVSLARADGLLNLIEAEANPPSKLQKIGNVLAR